MSNELVVISNNQVPVFKNKELNEITKKIAELDNNVRVNYFKIAIELRWVKDLELYKEDGFVSVTEYANKIFGYSKATVSKMIKIVTNEYLLDDGTGTVFEKEDGQDFSLFQLEELLYLPRGEVVDLIQEGKITPSMTKYEIRDIVKAKKNQDIIDISASSISSVQSEQELKESDSTMVSSTNLSGSESVESSITGTNLSGDSTIVSSTTGLDDSDSLVQSESTMGGSNSEMPVEGSRIAQERFSSDLGSLDSQEGKKGLEGLMRDIPKELRNYILMLEEENKRLKEENFRLAHPVKRKRGRPRKERNDRNDKTN